MATPIRHLRWYIGGLLFLSTVINYIDRQTLSVLAPYIKTEFHWTNTDFALADHRVPHRLRVRSDRVGPAARSHRHAQRPDDRGRVLLGRGDARRRWRRASRASPASASCSASASRRTGPARRRPSPNGSRGATADGRSRCSTPARRSAARSRRSSCCGRITTFGSWRPAFIVTGLLGFLWLILFRMIYRRPEDHPRLSPEERTLILEGRASATTGAGLAPQLSHAAAPAADVGHHHRQVADRSGLVLHHRLVRDLSRREGVSPRREPARVLGAVSRRGSRQLRGRRRVELADRARLERRPRAQDWSCSSSGLGMTLLIPTVFTTSYATLVACFAISTFAYAAFSTMVLNLPADLYPSGSVASVSGMSGTGAGIGTIAATLLIGQVADRWSFEPILDRREPDSAGRDRGGAHARAQHEGYRARHRQSDLAHRQGD